MKHFVTAMVILFCISRAFAQDALNIQVENKKSGSVVGSLALVSGTSYYLNVFEAKVKKENTPTSGGFYSSAVGVDFLTKESEFKTLNWTGYTRTDVWSTDGKVGTTELKNADWQKSRFKVELQLVGKNGSVGSPVVYDWLSYSKREVTAKYTAEGCVTPKDSTTGTKWKSEAKLKFESPATKTPATFTNAGDTLVVTLKDTTNAVIAAYKYSITWADPKTFGINITSVTTNPSNGTFFNPTEKFTTTIVLKNDNGDTLKLTQGATNMVEKVNVWISGPKQAYRLIPAYRDIKLVDAYAAKTVTGFDAAKGTYEITLHDSMQLTPGTYTLLVRAKRKGYGPELEKYFLKDFQVKQAQSTTNASEPWASAACARCHTALNKHNATEYKQCIVCHNNSLTGKEMLKFAHNIHGKKNIRVCSTCHANSAGNDNASTLACKTCHDGSVSPVFPASHASFTDAVCGGCHGSGALSPDQAHAKLTSVGDDLLPAETSLQQNYPNPFNPGTIISFTLGKEQVVSIEIFNMLGERIDVLKVGSLPAGRHAVAWNATRFASGVYLCTLRAGSTTQTRKMLLMR